jgi:8-oxo-dGTP diphosphatase
VHECVAAILCQGDSVLLCHRHADRDWFPNVWDLPGGHVERDESRRDALARELREELGVEVVVPSAPFATIDDDALELHMDVWVIDEWCGNPANLAPDEHDELRWFARDEVADLGLADASYLPLLRSVLARNRE